MTENVELTAEEIEAFDGLNQSYMDMEDRINKTAPRCHFRPMAFEQEGYEAWWECSHCGHTRQVR